jgi:sugar phosphate permease
MAGVLALAAASGGDWRWCFYAGAGVLAIVWGQFFVLQRNRPEDAGVTPIDDPVTSVDESKEPDPPPASGWMGLSRDAWINLWLVGGFYFFVKLVRYAIWGWAAYFLVVKFKMSASTANLLATAFGVFGLPGVDLTGYLSDKYFGSRRSGVALSMMVGMTIATGLLLAFGGSSVVMFVILLGAVGFTLFGPDALLTGAGAMDIGGRRAATFAAGFISGVGSLGPVVQELVIGRLTDAAKTRVCGLYEGKLTCWEAQPLTPVFVLLFSSAAIATLFCFLLAQRNKRGGNGV